MSFMKHEFTYPRESLVIRGNTGVLHEADRPVCLCWLPDRRTVKLSGRGHAKLNRVSDEA